MLALINNENAETIEKILNFLKINFQLNPELITVDFGKAGLKAINKIFPNARIFPCYFHMIRRLCLHIKNLKSSNKVIKRAAKNLLFNMKILLFIDSDKIDSFFTLIKNKYYNTNKKFFIYFEKYYMENKIIKDRQWNYYNFLKSENDINRYFFTNNVCESLNRTLNGFYKYSKKTFYSFQLTLEKLIDHYDNHIDYIEKNVSITRILAWYCKCHDIKELKNYKDIEDMTKAYNDHFQYNINDNENEELNSSNLNIEEESSISSSIISSNFYSLRREYN